MKMFRTLATSLLAALLLILVGCSGQGASSHSSGLRSAAESLLPEKLVIIHTNDVHGYLESSDTCLGIAAVSQLKADYVAKGYDVLLLDGGDAIQGNMLVGLNKGQEVPDFMNAAGYDAMALGNHEFDYGSDVLQERTEACNFPVLCANIVVDATGEPFAETHKVFTLSNGAKVGVFALDTPSTSTTSKPSNTKGLSFLSGEDLYKCAQDQIDGLRAEGCSVVVCIGHLGEIPSHEPNRASDVIAKTTGLDVFIDAHDHEVENAMLTDASGKEVLVVETGCHLENIGVLTWGDNGFTENLIAAGGYDGSDASVASLVSAANDTIVKALSEKVGTTPFELNGSGNPSVRNSETNLGDFCTDAVLWLVGNHADVRPDAAILNGGCIRANIEAGDVTLRDICEVMPFDDQLCVIQVTGAQLLEALEAATQNAPEELGSFPQVSGIQYSINTSIPYEKGDLYPNSTFYAPANPGARVTLSDVGGKGFDLQATYNIATTGFISQGGDTYYCFAEAAVDNSYTIGYTDYQALQYYLQDELDGTVPEAYAQSQGRVVEE